MATLSAWAFLQITGESLRYLPPWVLLLFFARIAHSKKKKKLWLHCNYVAALGDVCLYF